MNLAGAGSAGSKLGMGRVAVVTGAGRGIGATIVDALAASTGSVAPPPPPASTALPRGFTVRLGDEVNTADGGRTLFGGSPPRLLYLRPKAQRLLARGQVEVGDAASAVLARLLLDRGLAAPVAASGLPGVPRFADVTVVVPVKDRPLGLARLLAALPPDVQVIVVDDGSADAVPTATVAARAGARLLRHPESRGPASARNTGLQGVRTPFVAFLDSDVVPRDGWLETLLRHFADPAVGMVAPRIAALETGQHAVIARYEAARSSLDLGPTPALVAPRGRVAYVPSACLVGRVHAFGAGFDESLHVAEDVDLIWRTIEHGWRVRYEPAAVVDHALRVDIREWLSRKAFYGTGAALLAQRHRGAVAPVVLSPWTAAVAAAVFSQRRWSLPLAAAMTAGATWRLSRRLLHSDHPVRAAAVLAPYGVTAALWQTGAALTRHWWPVAATTALFSRRMRRALIAAAVLDGLADWRKIRPDLDPARYILARRMDDLAYGAGLWCGALRHRTAAPLAPDIVRGTRG